MIKIINKSIFKIPHKVTKFPLNHTSSGIQSIIPLFIVTKYLTEFTSQKYIPSSNLSIDDLRKQKIKNEQDIKKIKDEINMRNSLRRFL